ncbi:MAG: hypothetical protein ACHQVS_03835 [Candidatus Babeliales bacterium]
MLHIYIFPLLLMSCLLYSAEEHKCTPLSNRHEQVGMLIRKVEVKSQYPIISYSKQSELKPGLHTIATQITKKTGKSEYYVYIIYVGNPMPIDGGRSAQNQFNKFEKQYEKEKATRENLFKILGINS